jgi:hypothetical protein
MFTKIKEFFLGKPAPEVQAPYKVEAPVVAPTMTPAKVAETAPIASTPTVKKPAVKKPQTSKKPAAAITAVKKPATKKPTTKKST